MEESRYVLFRSFPMACLITAIMCWLTIASIWFRNHGTTVFPWFPSVMIGFTIIVLAAWIRKSGQLLERWFFAIWIGILICAIPAVGAHAQVLVIARHAVTVLYQIETLVALRITVDIGRPFYQNARSQRIARQQGDTAGRE